jgi:alkylated DNA nucleotide flippase Atl1
LRKLPSKSELAWHRVVRADGTIAERGDGRALREHRRRLRAEGVRFDRRGRIDLSRWGWNPSWG